MTNILPQMWIIVDLWRLNIWAFVCLEPAKPYQGIWTYKTTSCSGAKKNGRIPCFLPRASKLPSEAPVTSMTDIRELNSDGKVKPSRKASSSSTNLGTDGHLLSDCKWVCTGVLRIAGFPGHGLPPGHLVICWIMSAYDSLGLVGCLTRNLWCYFPKILFSIEVYHLKKNQG